MSSGGPAQPLRVGVSGATGFIGLELIRQLLPCDDVSVHALVRQSSPNIIPLEVLLSNPGPVENDAIRTADIADEDSAANALCGLDVVVHLAGVLDGFVGTDKNRAEELNLQMAKGMVNGAVKAANQSGYGPRKKILFIHVSTAEVYGPTSPNGEYAYEDSIQRPDSPYGRGKRDAEDAILEVFQENKEILDLVILRPPGVYGPNEQFFFKELLELCESGWGIICPSPCTGKVMFVHIDDVVSAIILAMRKERHDGNIYNICPNQGLSYEQVIRVLNSSFNRRGPLFQIPPSVGRFLMRVLGKLVYLGKSNQRFLYHPDNIPRTMQNRLYANVNAKEQLGWAPKYEMTQGMRKVALQEAAEGRIKNRKYPPTLHALFSAVAIIIVWRLKH